MKPTRAGTRGSHLVSAMATTGLKITFKAAAPAAGDHEPASKKPRPNAGGAPWSDPNWADQFKQLAPPPPRAERSALVELRTGGAPPPAAHRADAPSGPALGAVPIAEATTMSKRPAGGHDEFLDDNERDFRDDLAHFLKFRSRHDLYSPIFLGIPLPFRKVFKKVRALGGYAKICEQKLWMRVCREAANGKDLSGQTSASFAMRKNYEKTGMLEWERHLDGTSLPQDAAPDQDAGKKFTAVNADAVLLPGRRVRVLWMEPNGESAWYGANVKKFDPADKKHFIAYDDGTEESIDFGEEKVEAVVDGDGD